MPEKLNIAVFGAGTFGRNHLRVYRQLEGVGFPLRLAAIVDTDQRTASRLRDEWGTPVFATAEECLDARQAGELAIDAASITAPTPAHYRAASLCLEHGIDVLIEKPFTQTLDEADAIIRMAEDTGRIVQIGHVERFNPAVMAAARLLHGPMFFEAHRLSVFTPRALDVDVVLDLMIHDLDIVLSFVRSPVLEVRAVGLPVLSSKVDIANVRVEFASGAVANFTASRVSTEKVRKLRFFQPRQYISIDYARQDLLLIHVDKDATANLAAPDGSPGLAFDKPAVENGEPLRLEIEAFLSSVRTRTPARVTARQGRDALALAIEINREILNHSSRAGLTN